MSKSLIKNNRTETVVLSLFWMAYAFLCFYFFVERSTYADNSYYLFEMIQKKSFCIQYDRYFAITTQWLPLLAIKLKLPLNIVMLAFSLSPFILYLFIFLLIRYLSNEKWLSYIYLGTLLLTVHDSFFYVNDELNQASGLLILIVAVLRSDKLQTNWKLFVLFIVIMCLHFAHLFLLLAAGAILFIWFLEKKEKSALFGILFVVLIVMARAILFKSGRDGSSIDSLDWKFITLRNIHSSVFAVFFKNMVLLYYLPAIVIIIVLMTVNKSLLITKLMSLLIVIGFYILLIVFLRNSMSKMYNDKYLAVLFLILWSVVAAVISSEKSDKYWIYGLFMFAVAFSFIKLSNEKIYTKRVDYLTDLMNQKPVKQIYLFEKVPDYLQIMSWSVPYETLFISSLGTDTKTILIKEKFYKMDQYLSDSTLFLGAEWTFGNPNQLDKRYFPLKEAIYKYK